MMNSGEGGAAAAAAASTSAVNGNGSAEGTGPRRNSKRPKCMIIFFVYLFFGSSFDFLIRVSILRSCLLNYGFFELKYFLDLYSTLSIRVSIAELGIIKLSNLDSISMALVRASIIHLSPELGVIETQYFFRIPVRLL